jgi:hypothetical protein
MPGHLTSEIIGQCENDDEAKALMEGRLGQQEFVESLSRNVLLRFCKRLFIPTITDHSSGQHHHAGIAFLAMFPSHPKLSSFPFECFLVSPGQDAVKLRQKWRTSFWLCQMFLVHWLLI